MDNLDEFYRAYGEGLASRLAGIAHGETQKRFVFVADVEKPDEVLKFITDNGAKVTESQPIFVWDNFEESLETAGRDNYHCPLICSLSIIMRTTDSAKFTKGDAYQKGRSIVLKALALMIQDSQEGCLEEEGIQVDVQKFPLQKVGPVSGTWYGYSVEFSWTVPIDLSLCEADVLPA